MSPGMVKFALWAVLILVVCYMFALSPVGIVSDVTHAVQQVHNSSTNGGHHP
jgi:hypothetical protein